MHFKLQCISVFISHDVQCSYIVTVRPILYSLHLFFFLFQRLSDQFKQLQLSAIEQHRQTELKIANARNDQIKKETELKSKVDETQTVVGLYEIYIS